MDWNEIVYYKEGALYWKIKRSHNAKVGDECGYRSSTGYIIFEYENKCYTAHRVIWQLFNGEIPDGLEIDHIDRDRSNNLVENLRLSTRKENAANSSLSKRNTSGFRGVSYDKRRSKFFAQIVFNKQKQFLGYFETAEQASQAYNYSAEKLFGEFYNGPI